MKNKESKHENMNDKRISGGGGHREEAKNKEWNTNMTEQCVAAQGRQHQ